MTGDHDTDGVRRGAAWDNGGEDESPPERERHMRPGDSDFDDVTWKPARKKPVEVEYADPDERTVIHTREGRIIADDGDYVIRGVDDEIYPISVEIFHKTYDALDGADGGCE
jgi:hypothetical protein